MTLREAISKEPFEKGADALLGHGAEALADDVSESAPAVVGHELRVLCSSAGGTNPG
jgi:hypothetical protein